ncbi:MAG TPA: ABC transporter permease [Gemmatimonadaceae bacterium]|nr:ABC transporter permease [Gemmatimonadaceae bacterium]
MGPRELFNRLRDRFRRDRLAAELEEELRYHSQLLERDAHTCRRSFGNSTYYREETRAMWSLGIIDDLLHDVRYAARVLRRDALFTAAVVVTLALGIGANTAVFSIVNAVLLRELPYSDPERLVSIWTSQTGSPADRHPTSLPDVRDWQRRGTGFSGVAGYASNVFDASGPEGETQARGVLGTGNLYEVLGARPIIGRMPRPDEETSPVTAISYRLWKERFGGAPDIVGHTLRLNGQPYTIIGVMSRGFHFPSPDYDLWTSLYSITSSPRADGQNPWITSRSLRGYRVVARLAPGATMQQAERDMNALEQQLGKEYPQIDSGIDIHLQSVRDDTVGKVRRGLWTVFGAAGLILLLACVNVAHLLLSRLSARGRELAVRRALGAHRGRVVRQLITESLLLGVLGGAAGLIVALASLRALVRFSPGDIPRLDSVAIDGQTLGFAFALSLITGLLFGVLPAFMGWGRDLHESLRSQGKSAGAGVHGRRTRATLTVIEVAFAVVLLVGAGLMLRSFAELTSTDLGVQPGGVTVVQLTMVGPNYQRDELKTRALDAVLENLRRIPGVVTVGASTSMPPSHIQEAEGFQIVGQPAPQPGHEPIATYIPATQGYLEALRIPVIRGRAFEMRDNATSSPVMIISAELARRHFASVDPIGHEINVNGADHEIIGIVGDAVYEGVGAPLSPVMYVPYAQAPFPGVWIAIRGSQTADALATAVRDAIHRVDTGLPAHRPIALESMVAESVVRPRFHAWLLGTFGGIALMLASIGIYSVIAYGVAQRRPEIGIRLALGASTRSVIGMVLRGGMLPVIGGIAAGLIVAALSARVLAGLLYGIAPTDVRTYAGVAVLLGAAGLTAAYVPARRAARVDPLTAIRAE